MNECKGIFGRLFGHRFATMVESTPPDLEHVKGGAAAINALIDGLTTHKVIGLYCKRCGEQKAKP